VVWGELDYLLIDIPPGTDKIGRFLDLVPEPEQVLLVTIPTEVASSVVSRSATQLKEAGIACMGVVGNMSGYAQPGGGDLLPLFTGPDVSDVAAAAGLELWAEIPFDPAFGTNTDRGAPPGSDGDSVAARAFAALAERVEQGPGGRESQR
jgi:ATP-binding protein involved in chromosome partitioning